MGLISWLGQMVALRRGQETRAARGEICAELGQTGADGEPQDERRIWVRLAADVSAKYAPMGEPDGRRFSAQIVNVSRGGCKLALHDPPPVGSFLCVELPGRQAAELLAFVVRANPRRGGGWEIGCTFCLDLEDDDVQRLGGQRLKPAPPDRRSWERLPGRAEVIYQVVGASPLQWQSARLVDVSPGGIALRVPAPIPLRSMFRLELRGGDWQEALVLLASVVRMTEIETGAWVLGCSFMRELSNDELNSLTKRASDD